MTFDWASCWAMTGQQQGANGWHPGHQLLDANAGVQVDHVEVVAHAGAVAC